MGCQDINRDRKEEKMRQKREMHELPYTKIVKTWTIVLTYDISTFRGIFGYVVLLQLNTLNAMFDSRFPLL